METNPVPQLQLGRLHREDRLRQTTHNALKMAFWGAALPFFGLYLGLTIYFRDYRLAISLSLIVLLAGTMWRAYRRLTQVLDTPAIMLTSVCVLAHQIVTSALLEQVLQDCLMACFGVLVLMAITLGRRGFLRLGILTTVGMVLAVLLPMSGLIEQYRLPGIILDLFHVFSILVLFPVILYLLQASRALNEEYIRFHEEEITSTIQQARCIARGDLTLQVAGEGELASAFRQMVAGLQQLVAGIIETAGNVNRTAAMILATTRLQEEGATRQTSMVEHNRRGIDNLLQNMEQIAITTTEVQRNADQTDTNSRLAADYLSTLVAQIQRIAEISATIMEIANKSDLLALNAALEGTRAGEAGRGFSLVANQMQQLAANVRLAANDIRALAAVISKSAQETMSAARESTKLSTDTARSLRHIGLVIRQQQDSTAEATRAMVDVEQIAHDAATASGQVVDAVNDLVQQSEMLQQLIRSFKIVSEEG